VQVAQGSRIIYSQAPGNTAGSFLDSGPARTNDHLQMEFFMAEDLLTIKEIAKRLDVPESNIRYYRDRFEDFLPSLGEGRKRRYKPEALDVFRFIVQGYKNDLNTEDITRRLLTRFPRNLEPEEHGQGGDPHSPAPSPLQFPSSLQQSLLQSQARALEHVTRALMQKHGLEKQFDDLSSEQSKIKKGLLLVWKKFKQDRCSQEMLNVGRQAGTEQGDAELHRLKERCRDLEVRQKELEERFDSHAHEVSDLLDRCFHALEQLLERLEHMEQSGQHGSGPDHEGTL